MRQISISLAITGLFLILIILASFASAITGSIGNARMILHVEKGDTIDRTILVKNVNNVTVNIELFASGDLEKDINIIDNKFTLLAGEEKKARFQIPIKKTGTTTSQINVQFTPTDGKNGVGLSSTIIVIASNPGELNTSQDETSTEDNSNNTDDVSVTTGNVVSNSSNNTSTGAVILIISAIVLLVIVIILLIVVLKKKKQKEQRGKKQEATTKRKKSVNHREKH